MATSSTVRRYQDRIEAITDTRPRSTNLSYLRRRLRTLTGSDRLETAYPPQGIDRNIQARRLMTGDTVMIENADGSQYNRIVKDVLVFKGYTNSAVKHQPRIYAVVVNETSTGLEMLELSPNRVVTVIENATRSRRRATVNRELYAGS